MSTQNDPSEPTPPSQPDPADRTVADAAAEDPAQANLNKGPTSDKNPNPRAPLARDPGQRPAN